MSSVLGQYLLYNPHLLLAATAENPSGMKPPPVDVRISTEPKARKHLSGIRHLAKRTRLDIAKSAMHFGLSRAVPANLQKYWTETNCDWRKLEPDEWGLHLLADYSAWVATNFPRGGTTHLSSAKMWCTVWGRLSSFSEKSYSVLWNRLAGHTKQNFPREKADPVLSHMIEIDESWQETMMCKIFCLTGGRVISVERNGNVLERTKRDTTIIIIPKAPLLDRRHKPPTKATTVTPAKPAVAVRTTAHGTRSSASSSSGNTGGLNSTGYRSSLKPNISFPKAKAGAKTFKFTAAKAGDKIPKFDVGLRKRK